jgi:hypothetical protein
MLEKRDRRPPRRRKVGAKPRPKGVLHCTRAPERSVILMVETAAIVPTGDA